MVRAAVRDVFAVYAWPAITYVSSILVTQEQYNLSFRHVQMENNGATSTLFGNTRMMLTTNSITQDQVRMSLWYSRLMTSDQDYYKFFGISPDETNIPHVDYEFNAMVAEEIDEIHSQQSLPHPFDIAYKLCKAGSVSQKWRLHSVQRSPLTTDVTRGVLSMPAVLIGNAAHTIPETFSPGDISKAMADAVSLCSMIRERYDDDESFSSISADFYRLKYPVWRHLLHTWENKWKSAHGLPSAVGGAIPWIPIQRTNSLQPREDMAELDLASRPAENREKVVRFREGDAARWEQIQQRIRDRHKFRDAFKTRKGVNPTKIVLRYLDSKSPPPVEGNQRTDVQKKVVDDDISMIPPLVRD